MKSFKRLEMWKCEWTDRPTDHLTDTKENENKKIQQEKGAKYFLKMMRNMTKGSFAESDITIEFLQQKLW